MSNNKEIKKSMKKYIVIIALSVFSTKYYAQTKTDISSLIQKNMHDQELAWNKGDIDGFMSTYWNSDSLKFIGKNGVTFGWKNTLDNYKKNYPDAAAMGTLNFELISVEPLSPTTCYVIGSWNLTRKKGNVSGFYTLLWKKINDKWVIVTDHTS